MTGLAALLFGLLVLLTLRQSRRPLSSKAWLLLRSLLPSWRFFEDVVPGPRLWFQVAAQGQDFGPWQPALVPPQRVRFLLNPEGNLQLAYQSLVEQLQAELDGMPFETAPTLTPYRLVQELVKERARGLGDTCAVLPTRYRFRLCSAEDGEVAFQSEEHEL